MVRGVSSPEALSAAAEAAEHLAALETQQQEKQTAQQQARTACDALRAEQREKAQRLSACEQALTRQQERLSGLTVDLRSTESRIRMLMEMEKDFEGYNRAVKAVMHAAEKGTLRGVRGPVANLIKTGDRYALAIETALGKLKEAHKNADVAAIDTAMAELNAAWQAASQDIYAQQQAQQGAQPGADAGQQSQSNAGGQQGGGDGQPEDVEFEEVK